MFRDDSALGRAVHALARWMAIAGGMVLLVMIVIVVVSIIGRALIPIGLKPILGDYELVTLGMGFAIFAFLPWAHIERGHALVSLLTDSFSARANNWILVVTDLMMFAASAFLAWRLQAGMVDKFTYRETTILLGFPMGWAYAAALVGAVVFAIVSAWVLGRTIGYALAGRSEPRKAGGGDV